MLKTEVTMDNSHGSTVAITVRLTSRLVGGENLRRDEHMSERLLAEEWLLEKIREAAAESRCFAEENGRKEESDAEG